MGAGFYATIEEEAVSYARKRGKGRGRGDEHYIQEIDVSEARLYDFRQRSNHQKNGRVPITVADVWQVYYEAHKVEVVEWMRRLRPEGVEDITETLQGYSEFLNSFLERLKVGLEESPLGVVKDNKFVSFGISDSFYQNGTVRRGLDLRDMLRTYLTDEECNSPLHSGLWTKFVMENLKCDGLIFNEAGEVGFQTPEGAPSYVLYNLDKITSQSIKGI